MAIKFLNTVSVDSSVLHVDAATDRVGIGTSSPSSKLHVVGTTHSIEIERVGGYASIKGSPAGGGNVVIDSSDSGGSLFLNHYVSSNVFIATGGGNAGIGTTSPSEKLTVSGNILATGTVTANNDTSSTSTPTLTMTNGGGGDVFTRLYEENNGHAWMSGMDVSDGAKYKFAYAADGSSLTTGTKMTIMTNGRVGIGTSSPTRTFHVSDVAPVIGGTSTNNSSGIRYDTVGTASLTHRFQYNGSTQVTIDNSGRMGIGASPTQKLQVDGNALADKFMLTSSVYSELFLGQMATTGLIRVGVGGGGSWAPVYASAFNVMSDYRLKSNVVTLGGAIDRVKQLNVYRFNWNDKLDEDKVDGFIAHELATVIPEAVTGEKDALHEDGTEDHQGVDQAKVVPLLTAALKEAIEKIEQLETRIQTLENNN